MPTRRTLWRVTQTVSIKLGCATIYYNILPSLFMPEACFSKYRHKTDTPLQTHLPVCSTQKPFWTEFSQSKVKSLYFQTFHVVRFLLGLRFYVRTRHPSPAPQISCCLTLRRRCSCIDVRPVATPPLRSNGADVYHTTSQKSRRSLHTSHKTLLRDNNRRGMREARWASKYRG